MYYIDPHIHMVSRTTDDYEMLAKMGCVGDERAGLLGRASTAAASTAFAIISASSPSSRRSGPPSTASSITRGCASTPKRPRTSAWPAK